MSDVQSNLVLRDIRLIVRMKSGWQFGHDNIDYYARKKRKKIFAESLDQLLNMIDQMKPAECQINVNSEKGA
jgi:hypothetical protein